jgi:predicted transposase/invertase (TIGR01784 family)
MMSFMDPKSDTGFKKLFGNKDHTDIIKSFLNAILKRSGKDAIQTISFAETENLRHPIEGKQTLLDMHAIDGNGHHYIIEMQNKYQKFYIERTQYYSSFVFSEQLNPNLYFDKLLPVISISILNHTFFDHHTDVISNHTLMDMKHKTITSMFQTFHYIELPKFKKTIEKCLSLEDKWLFFMQQAEKCHAIPEQVSQSKELVTAFKLLERMSWTHSDMADYIREQDSAGYEQRVIAGAKELGEKKGRAEGKAEGVQEAKEALVVKLLKKGMTISEIADLTELTIDQIDELRKKI